MSLSKAQQDPPTGDLQILQIPQTALSQPHPNQSTIPTNSPNPETQTNPLLPPSLSNSPSPCKSPNLTQIAFLISAIQSNSQNPSKISNSELRSLLVSLRT
jgi:hypothetical protein